MKRLKTIAQAAPQDTLKDVIGVMAIGGMLWAVLHLPVLT